MNTVIFDLDGTLLDTLGDLTDAVNAATANFGVSPATEEQVRQRVGDGVRKLIARSLPKTASETQIDQCLSGFRAYYGEHMMNRTKPYDGILSVLQQLQAAGVQIAVLSNKYDIAAKELTNHYFPGLISLTIGERDGIPKKPDPTSCLEVMQQLHTTPENTIYIGDSAVDMQTAQAAGVRSIGVTWGFRSRQDLQQAGATLLADHPYQLLDLILGVDVAALKQTFVSHGFVFSYFETGAQAAHYLSEQCKGQRIGFGGSITLEQLGIFETLQQQGEDVHWHWRGEDVCMDADIYLTSANALAKTGEVVNLDGRCNRVAATLFGCKRCIFVCGINKLTPTLCDAIKRARTIAAPQNAARLQKNTPCTQTGTCMDCRSPERICRALTVHLAPPMGMVCEIVLIGEQIGY